MEFESSKSSNKMDPGWKYNHAKDPKKNYSITLPLEVKEELWAVFWEKQELNVRSSAQYESDFFDIGDDTDDAEVEENRNSRSKRALVAMPSFSKANRTKGPMDLYLQKPEEVVEIRKKQGNGKLIQSNIKDFCDPKARERTIQYIARCFYQAGIPFNATRLDSFKVMVEVIGQYGLGLKPPSYHEIRVPLLKKELQLTKNLMKNRQEIWAKIGCSIMSDAWSDRRHRSIINFLVNCTAMTMFMESVDASSYTKIRDKLYELLDAFVEKIREENVVQVIMNNGSNYVLAGKLLQAKRKHLYWTPCVAHCVDLILEDIEKLGDVAVASGVGEPRIYTRRNTAEKIGRKEASSAKALAIARSRYDLEEEEEMVDAEDTEEEEIEGYNSSDGNESSDDAQIDVDEDNDLNFD
ncbi:hypothetical protein SLEP1_g43053 [Rubroshorea leprosula]|uniref:DUF659 domain-containing protein n=1 Tax=Rubroshorea leprosula TaxID=152421 RepID=A0AAV5LBR9_9ROSI|nr:hypothetical protein SLEP1_g43053 [Rubroshorea leprosula]